MPDEIRNAENDKRPRVSRRSTSSRHSDGTSYAKGDCIKRNSGAVGKPFPPRPMRCKLSATAWKKLEELFRCMDTDGSNAVTKVEAQAFFKGAFSSLSADAMFNEVDVDQSGAITGEEFAQFWLQVRAAGYEEQDIIDEVEVLMDGNTWVDWKDGRDTGKKEACTYPRKPFLCRLGGKAWGKSEELFRKLCGDGSLILTREKATSFFKGTFTKISVEAMFNEVDVNNHGVITPEEWIAFWLQVKSHGYKDSDIVQELNSMLEGSPWVDWKDGRNT
eukprot:CAMPEP_0179253922 /NCGR_PEP_ID=MMETSP0797-20121207/22981_1 /TAXON_ID=47934 /ORGANISM="Dinophysis acuminata, Strain DAEP01" /LENGTH=274 /DNA_ID=CAMNT_0020961801 /DNA_START=255 /DNA_END=1079 /DNA_ORIENTATION=-